MRRLFFCFFIIIFSSCGFNGKNTGVDSVADDDETRTDINSRDAFLGVNRAAAKTSYEDMPADTFSSVDALHNFLESDEHMHKKTDARFNDSPRTQQESENVALPNVYVFGIKREADNDFHLILGSDPDAGKDQVLMTAEITGLPDSTSKYFDKLAEVRNIFKNHFSPDIDKEVIFVADDDNPPIHLHLICGSLFFDNHHFGMPSSVRGYKVASAWEIHPVTSIRFEGK